MNWRTNPWRRRNSPQPAPVVPWEPVLDASKCVVEGRPFYCHKGVRDGERPKVLCAGASLLYHGPQHDLLVQAARTMAEGTEPSIRRHTRTRPGQPPATRIRTRELQVDRLLYPERDFWRPRTRADCATVPRPCPYVGCRYNLFLEVADGSGRRVGLRFNFHNRDVWELEHSSCALDFAERGGMTNAQVGEVLHCHTSVVSRVATRATRKAKSLAILR